MRKKNKEINILKMFIIVIVVSGVLIALFSYGSFLPGNVTVQNGTYLYTGTGNGEIVVSDDCQLCFRNFDLNTNLKCPSYTQDMNSIFLDKKNRFSLCMSGFNGEYSLLYTLSEEELFQVGYYPREDKLVLSVPGSSSREFVFELEK